MARDPLMDLADRHLIRYVPGFAPFLVERARGSWVWDRDGNRVLDFTSGQICSTIGHNHPRIVEAIRSACDRVLHLNSWMLSEEVVRLAARLAELLPAPLSKTIILNTGSEANEIAMRIAKLATGRFRVAGLDQSFHGLTAGAASVTWSVGRSGYGPQLPGVSMIPAPYAYRCPVKRLVGDIPGCDGCDRTCLERGFEAFDAGEGAGTLAATIAEPVLSAGGVIDPPPGYLARLAELTRARGGLLIVDEAQTGFGRLGTMFGFEGDGIVPDIVTVSKTLGGGLPIAATVISPELEQQIVDRGFVHVTSHVSDPLPAAVGLAVLDVVVEERLPERAAAMGARLRAGLLELADRHPIIGEVRGRGLLLGVELVIDRATREPADDLGALATDECLARGLSMNIVRHVGANSVWRIAPPLTVTEHEIDLALTIMDDSLRSVTATTTAPTPPRAPAPAPA
ncbi:MAG TPA: aspartate aminotransferase family protein [Candidatus Sulfomarinibacteraceae bacterium]|nr:aspartate aminotransferase family protein [Candidatus Sulfomarinibacteraceae bacterium]